MIYSTYPFKASRKGNYGRIVNSALIIAMGGSKLPLGLSRADTHEFIAAHAPNANVLAYLSCKYFGVCLDMYALA